MSERRHWRDAQEAVIWLRTRPSDHRAILLLARLPLADAKVLGCLSGVRGTTIIYRSLTRLQDAELIAGVTLPAERGSPPQRFHLTDLGLAVLALDRNCEVAELATRYHLRRCDLVRLLPRLPQLGALYDMLGALAASRPGHPELVAWNSPWHRRYRRPSAKHPVSITFPAFATLSWGDEMRTCLLLPDLGTFPPQTYRTALDRLLQLRRIEGLPLPPLIIATDPERGIGAWRELLEQGRRAHFDVPLAAHVVAWADLHAGLERLEARQGASHEPANHLIRPMSVPPLRPRRPASPLPRIVGHALSVPGRATKAADGVGHLALTLTPADYRLLSTVACHPFLPLDHLATVLDWQVDGIRRRRNRLIALGLMRLMEPGEIGEVAALQLAELTRVGLELVAAHRGLSLPGAIREIGFAGGGPEEPLGARTALLSHLTHTLGVDELFVSLYRTARQFAEAGGDDAMVEWQNATACSRRYLRPDGYGIYRRSGRRFGFFLEYDRGTMNRRDYIKKLCAYYDYAITHRFERDYYGYPTILVVTASNGAEERIARAARAAAISRTVALPLLLTCWWRVDDPTNPHGLLGRIWREPDVDFDDRRFWLPAPHGTIHHPASFAEGREPQSDRSTQ